MSEIGEQLACSDGRVCAWGVTEKRNVDREMNAPGGELLEALLVVGVVCIDVGTLDAGDAESSGLVETLDARCDLDTGLCGGADGASGDTEEGHCELSGERVSKKVN